MTSIGKNIYISDEFEIIMLDSTFKEIKTIAPKYKARKLIRIFDKYLLIGEDNALIEIYN